MSDRDREAYEYYLDPEHLKPAGPGRKRQRPNLSGMVPVRFTPEVIDRVKDVAFAEGITVSAWIRRLVLRALEHRTERPTGLIPGSGCMGELRALPSSRDPLTVTSSSGGTFTCPHLSISNVISATCFTCGPLRSVA